MALPQNRVEEAQSGVQSSSRSSVDSSNSVGSEKDSSTSLAASRAEGVPCKEGAPGLKDSGASNNNSSGPGQVSPKSNSPPRTASCTPPLGDEDAAPMMLPPPPPAALPVVCTKGWSTYLTSRWSGDRTIAQRVQGDSITLQRLTYPITLAFLLASLKFKVQELTVVVVGASSWEEDLLRDTSYWGEIAVCLRCRVHLILCGLSVSETRMHDGAAPGGDNLAPNSDTKVSLFAGSFLELKARHPLPPASTVLAVYNAGFGRVVSDSNQPEGLVGDALFRWMPELRALVESNLPVFFTQADEETDLVGEAALMAHVLGARFVVLPTQNPFSALRSCSAKAGSPASSNKPLCVNHSFYAVQGWDPARVLCRGADLSTPHGQAEVKGAAMRALRLGADLTALEAMTTRLDVNSPTASGGVRAHNLVEGATAGATRPGDWAAAVPDRPLKKLARLGDVTRVEVAPSLKEKPIPNYRLEVSQDEGLIRAVVALPLLETARAVDLEVYKGELLIAADGVYSVLKVALPRPVDEDTVIAKFDRRRRELELTIHSKPIHS